MSDLKPVYLALNLSMAKMKFDDLKEKCGKKYPIVIGSNLDNLTSYFAYYKYIRKLIYTTNAVEYFHRQVRKVIKTKCIFHNDMS